MLLDCRGKRLDLESRTHIMGVINCTPDSFYEGSRRVTVEQAVEAGVQMVEWGADILDVGGESTRPGSEPVSTDEELSRVMPVVEELLRCVEVPISIDTYKSEVAKAVFELGGHILNDISGLRFDPAMAKVAAQYDVAVVIMHIKGRPKDMQSDPTYEDVISELRAYFEERIQLCKANGIREERIVLDPGIGFGKRLDDNYEILARLSDFADLHRPLLLGPSRKSFISRVLDKPAKDTLNGTLAAITACVLGGSHIVRVHDVAEARDAVRIADKIVNVASKSRP